MPTVTVKYTTEDRVEIPVMEILGLLRPLLPPERIITGYSYDGGTAAFIIHLKSSTEDRHVIIEGR